MYGTGGFLNPEKILTSLNLIEKGMKAADFGCGAGYFSLPLAKMVGPDGKVSAVDILESALNIIESRSRLEGFFNIKTIKGNLENENGSSLPEKSQDIVFLANILFQSQKKEAILKEAIRILRKEGKIIIIDWLPGSTFSTDRGWRIAPEDIKKIGKKLRLNFEKDFAVDNYHYGLIFAKP